MATICPPRPIEAPPRPSRLAVLWQFCAQNPLGAAGGFVVIVMILMAAFADLVTVHDPTRNNFGAMLEAPGAEYWLGTDQFGRDLYTRIVYGARTALHGRVRVGVRRRHARAHPRRRQRLFRRPLRSDASSA